ncbi:DNA-directed DNA polymerase epsilon, subunit B [Coniosporium apollinis]|uniref:DNA polymerase epsilon subunit B n=1 Tax=Coniosporium apollinis TaxID=61459 RepID=A0ABQ9P0U2_9PEZI|nr:DNA-directed DNA polymerase epsilon, subunit B [Coniosporium apollinis]
MNRTLNRKPAPTNPIPSSSPAFSTPLHPLPATVSAPIPAPPALKPTILPILLPPATLRPLAFRTFTKKHNLTLTSSALALLATFVGRHCGSGWRDEGLAERVLEEVARAWKRGSGDVIVDAAGEGGALKGILKGLEECMVGGRVVVGKTGGLMREGSSRLGPDGGVAGARPGLLQSESSFGLGGLEVDEEEEENGSRDPRDWIKVIDAFEQPRLTYNVNKEHFERSTTRASLFPPPSHRTDLFRQRYHLVHQRCLRNESFQAPSFSGNRSLHRTSSLSVSQSHKITPIANLLGRSGTNHVLLGLLIVSASGTLALSDLTGTIALDIQHARPVPEDGAYFAPGMIVLVDGAYEEDYSNPGAGSMSALGDAGGIGGTIGGKFVAFSVGHPPCEQRATTLGIADKGSGVNEAYIGTGPAFGWTDFLGVGSERATGARMRRVEQRLLGPGAPHHDNARIAIASQVNLDNPATLSALRMMLDSYASLPPTAFPMAVVLMGNFCSKAVMAGTPGAGSIEYKEHFNSLAAVLSEFPQLLARTTLVFMPGDNDAWPSAFSAGTACPLPRKGLPEMFTSRVRRAVAEANRDVGGPGKKGEVVWSTNPARLSWFGYLGEMVLFRDDVCGRLRRTGLRFKKPGDAGDGDDDELQESSSRRQEATSREPVISEVAELVTQDSQPMDLDSVPIPPAAAASADSSDEDALTARRLTRTLLDQSHLSPFPLSTRPVHWDYAHALSLYPLPTSLVIADSEAPAFALRYEGCCVMNPGKLMEGRRGERAQWVEYDVLSGKGEVRWKDS